MTNNTEREAALQHQLDAAQRLFAAVVLQEPEQTLRVGKAALELVDAEPRFEHDYDSINEVHVIRLVTT